MDGASKLSGGRPNDKNINIGVYVLLFLPLLINAAFIKIFGANVPIIDDWFTMPLFDKLYSGSLTFLDLVMPLPQYPAYTTFFPKVIRLVLGFITHYNTVAEMYFDWLLVALAFSVLLVACIQAFGFTRRTLLQFIPVGWLLFSLRQMGATLWGGTMGYYISMVCAIGSFHLLAASKKPDLRFFTSIVLIFVATFSCGGIYIWPIGLIQILILNESEKRDKVIKAVLWSLAAAIALLVYALAVKGNAQGLGVSNIFRNPIASFMFFVINVGASLCWDKASAFGAGILLLIFYVSAFAMIKSIPASFRSTLSLILFSVASSAAVLAVRGGLGLDTAIQSRYTPMTTIGVIGAYLAIVSWFNKDTKNTFRAFVYGFFMAMIIYGLIVSYSFGAGRSAMYMREGFEKNISAAHNIDKMTDEEMRKLLWDREDVPGVIREGVRIMKKYKLSLFH